MGAEDFHFDDFDNDALDEARYERDSRLHPSSTPPGQDDFFGGGGNDIFNSSVESSYGGDSMGDIFGASSSPLSNPFSGNQGAIYGSQPQQSQTQANSAEEMFYSTLKKGGSSALDATKDIIHNSKTNALFKVDWGRTSAIAGIICVPVGILLRIFGMKQGLDFTVAGALGAAFGAILWGFNEEKSHKEEPMFGDDNDNMVDNTMENAFDLSPEDMFSNNIESDSDEPFMGFNNDGEENNWGIDENESTPSDSIFSEEEKEESKDDEFTFEDIDDEPKQKEEQELGTCLTNEEALARMGDTVPVNVYTRQYLFDTFVQRLPNYKPDFAELKSFDEDDPVFTEWEQRLREASTVSGVKDENLPTLLELKQNLFSIIIVCSRTAGFKADVVGAEIARMYEHKVTDDGEIDEGKIFAKTVAAGTQATITIFLGAKALISLRDMLEVPEVKKFFLNTKNYMPVVLGTNQLGHVIYTDFKKIESVLITGMPRSGKSWFVQQTLTQMCAFVSPRELNIYVCDPKDGISDFKSFCLPHIKKFVSGDDNIVNVIRNVVKVEGPRRKQIIGDAGCVNIWDYKELHQEVDMPLIYILIDEVVTLAQRMEKDTKTEFQNLLMELISQMPALGIRALLIPHEVKNDIIKKEITDLIMCRISVLGSAEHIESSTGTKPKDFPYKLTSQGDMAVRIPIVNPKTMYVHAPALTSENIENNRVFDYMRQVWKRIEPDSYGGAVVEKAESDKENQELLESMQDINNLNSDIDNLVTESDTDDDFGDLL